VYFKPGSTCMARVNLFLIAFLALIVWRFVFAGLRCRPWVRAIAARQQRRNYLFEVGLHSSCFERVAINAGNRFENGPGGLGPLDPKDRAKAYLRRIVALTGATQMGSDYVLDVGTARFYVSYRYVRRLRDAAVDPNCACEETCFYPVHKGMPKAEEIATALLQLANNPMLYDKWAVKNGLPLKADGQVFTQVQ
jgi:hypothetical protein